MNRPLLIFIATYNEAENVEPMCHALLALGLDADLLFCDDHSPDGSGAILDRLAAANSRIQVLHPSALPIRLESLMPMHTVMNN